MFPCHRRPPVHQLPTKTLPAQFAPTRKFSQFFNQNVVVPVVHPSHTTRFLNTNFQFVHSFPHTTSDVRTATRQDFVAPAPRPRRPFSWW
ncbi:CotD family spore coat protein [Halalkalibacterium halodurans]|uniref:CotD family spore coat protein n=1 Tax=Halalkalibacterium halodurans TaxID=86665 RepID=UPI0009F92BE7|nr:spore coat protein [Halalkalibacterium halodurans]